MSEAVASGRARRGHTVVELAVATLIALAVIGACYVLFGSGLRGGKKAQDLSSAVQAAAALFHCLETDFSNLFVAPDARGGADPVRTCGREEKDKAKNRRVDLVILRGYARKPPMMSSSLSVSPIKVRYVAVKGANGFWSISRVVNDDYARGFRFAGIVAEEVRFSDPFEFNGKRFLRFSILLVGDDVDPGKVSSANQAKRFLLTTLLRYPKPQ